MVRRRAYAAVIVVLFSAGLFPPSAFADRILAGSGQATWAGAGVTLETADGFRFGASWVPLWGVVPAGPTPLLPDAETSLRAHGSGSGSGGYLSYRGEEFWATGAISSVRTPFASATFEGSFRTPPIGGSATVTAPFDFAGSFSFQPSWAEDWERFEIDGRGIATIKLQEWRGGSDRAWVIDSIRYDFSTAEPVPEPGTMLLAGLGIAGIARRVRRRRG